jgi:thioester reductase-like protein
MPTVFLTGFPGFLGSGLVTRLLDRYDEATTVTCLVQPKFRDRAESRAAELADDPDRVDLVEGDITDPDLGLAADTYDDLQDEAIEVFHLAAVYDLATEREPARQVNVEGTRHMLDFAGGVDDLRRFQYVSTVTVAGTYDGRFREDMLQEGQRFCNYYETTKHMAEVLVQQRMDEIPTTIYRPGVAVGDSDTGETDKFDGMYELLALLEDQGSAAVLPIVPGARDAEFNVVPRDFIVDAIGHLSGIDDSAGEVYHLTDPDPPTTVELVKILGEELGKSVTFTPPIVPKGLVEGVAASLARFSDDAAEFVRSGGLTYFAWPPTFDCSNTVRDLEGSGIECPPFEAYADVLVEFYENNPQVGAEAMN